MSNFYCPDNIMALYGANSGAPMKNVTVLNGVVGSNYAPHPLPPAPVGTYRFPIDLASPAFTTPPPEKAPPDNQPPDRKTLFREWRNYQHIYLCSDHMAIIADI